MTYVLWPSVAGFEREGSLLFCVGRVVGYGREWRLVERGTGKARVHAPYSFEGKLQC